MRNRFICAIFNQPLKPFIMIKHLLLVFSLVFSMDTNAQGLANLSFENWSFGPFGNAPDGYFGADLTQQTTGAQSGTSYVRITTTDTSASNNDGFMILAQLTASFTFQIGEPYTNKPISMNGFYKTSGLLSGDTVTVQSVLFNMGTFVGFAQFQDTANVSGWTSFSAPFVYFSALNPDTLFISASSNAQSIGGGPNAIGSTLDLDNLSFALPLGAVEKTSVGTSFLVYPNPASGIINIKSKDVNAKSVVISNVMGELISETAIEAENTVIDLQNFASGIYSYSILGKDGATLLQSKLVVTK